MNRRGIVPSLLRRWDACAYAQMAEHVNELAQRLEAAELRAYHAENEADAWRADFMAETERTGSRVGITMDGRCVGLESESDAQE